jgi:DNA topoisomerase-1
VLAARALRDLGPAETKTKLKANIVSAIDAVASRLGNTRAVCRASYIHPVVLTGYETGLLLAYTCKGECHPALEQDEHWTLEYLKDADDLS